MRALFEPPTLTWPDLGSGRLPRLPVLPDRPRPAVVFPHGDVVRWAHRPL